MVHRFCLLVCLGVCVWFTFVHMFILSRNLQNTQAQMTNVFVGILKFKRNQIVNVETAPLPHRDDLGKVCMVYYGLLM
jgi:hypothetical protein